LLLPLGGYARSLIVLLAAFGVLIGSLFAPLLAWQFVNWAVYAAVLVALIWLAQLIFVRMRKRAGGQ